MVQGTEGQDRRFYNNLNSKTVKSVGELASAMALLHNAIKVDGVGGVIPVDSAARVGWERKSIRPPSTVMTWPMMNDALSEARKTTTFATHGPAHLL